MSEKAGVVPKVPFTMFETVYTYVGDRLTACCVKPIQVTRYGVSTELGATEPSISFTSHDGHKARGSFDMFYLREADALEEATTALAEQHKKDAFPAILEAARLGVCSDEIKEEMEISDEEAARLHSVIVEMQNFGSEV